MSPGIPPRPVRAAIVAGLLTALSGCSGSSSFLASRPTVGQMKTSLASLESENLQMKRDLAKLRRENARMASRLDEQERDNGELTARLDDARNLLRERGADPEEAEESRRPRTLPAGQPSRKPRQPPVARVRGGTFTPAPPQRRDDREDETLGPPQASPEAGEDLDHHTFYEPPLRWAPIAGRTGDFPRR